MKMLELTIQGMSCGHCVMAVRKGLGTIPNLIVERVEIGKAVIRYDEAQVNVEDIRLAVEKTGYSVVP